MSDSSIAAVANADVVGDGAVSDVTPGAEPYGWIGLPVTTIAILVLGAALTAACLALAFAVLCLVVGYHEAYATIDVLLSDATKDISSETSGILVSSLSILLYLSIAIVILALARARAGMGWRDLLGWHAWAPLKARRSFWIIVGVTLVFSLIANEALSTFYPPSRDWVTLPKGLPAIVLFFVLAVVCAPLTEELLFRGWLYTGLRAKLGRWGALALSSILFALAHYEPTLLYASAVLPVGVALGLIREREHSLKASMSFHALFNAVAFALILFGM